MSARKPIQRILASLSRLTRVVLDASFQCLRYLFAQRRHYVLPLLTVLALQIDVFGIGAATQAQSENTILRLMAPWYPAAAQSRVSVVLIDQAFLDEKPPPAELEGGAQVPYYDFTYLVDRILAVRPQPRALYLHFVFNTKSPGSEQSLANLLDLLDEAASSNVPVVLAMNTTTNQHQGVGSMCELMSATARISFDTRSVLASVVERVARSKGRIRFAAGNWFGCDNRYPLTLDAEGQVPSVAWLMASLDDWCDPEEEPHCHFSGVRGRALERRGEQMLVRWSAYPSRDRFAYGSVCPPSQDPNARHRWWLAAADLWRSAMQALTSLAARGERLECHYIDEIQAWSVMKNRVRVEPFLRDRIVFIGLDSTLAPRRVDTPVNGSVPAVILHAAATENLLSLGDDYVREWPDWLRTVLEAIVVLIVASIAILARRLPHLSQRLGWRRQSVVGWLIAVCIGVAFLALLSEGASDTKTIAVLGLVALAWMLHSPLTPLVALFCLVAGAIAMVATVHAARAPLDWIGVLLAGATSLLGSDEDTA